MGKGRRKAYVCTSDGEQHVILFDGGEDRILARILNVPFVMDDEGAWVNTDHIVSFWTSDEEV